MKRLVIRLTKAYVEFWMGYGCEATGHRLYCYNTSPKWVKRLWIWSVIK